ncbi:MAG TPA: heparinase II/III family protein [Burkholderiales bacterium]
MAPARAGHLAALALALALCAYAGACAACQPGAAIDWIAQADPLYARAAPADCAESAQSPPDFTWPPYPGAQQYEFLLDFADGHSESALTTVNWLNWPRPLEPGDYAWRVRPIGGATEPVSQARRFTLAAGAMPFSPPPAQVLVQRAQQAARPRSLPAGTADRLWRASLAGTRARDVAALRQRVLAYRGQAVRDPVAAMRASASAAPLIQLQVAAEGEATRLLETALYWVIAGVPADRDEAIRRCLAIAAWPPQGATSYANTDTVAMEVAWILAVTYDWLHDELSPQQRLLVQAAITGRAAPAFAALAGPRCSFAPHPYDSHGAHIVAQVAAIGALLTGEVDAARDWLQYAGPLYAHFLSPWGGEHGGYANGTSYALWDNDSMFFMWDVLARTTGLDLTQKAWARNFGQLFAYFMPPGAPAGLFGDGAEAQLNEEWARIALDYAARVPSPLMRWYTGQVQGGDGSLQWSLLAPPAPAPGPVPPDLPLALLMPSTGWTAMQASRAKPSPFSVYFKSSPYGSFNHGHADQNSFVIHAGGEALTGASGVFDWYASPHWRQWYAQTRAANAITYDGGQGQMLGPRGDGLLQASGRIVDFYTDAQADVVVGDAAAAYGPGFSRATRALVYLRPHTVVVFDDIETGTAHQWEWNLHTEKSMSQGADGTIAIKGAAASLCARTFAPAGSSTAASSGYPVAPAGVPAPPHHQITLRTPRNTSGRFISVFDTDCAALAALRAPALAGATMSITVGDTRVSFQSDAKQVTLTPLAPGGAGLIPASAAPHP